MLRSRGGLRADMRRAAEAALTALPTREACRLCRRAVLRPPARRLLARARRRRAAEAALTALPTREACRLCRRAVLRPPARRLLARARRRRAGGEAPRTTSPSG